MKPNKAETVSVVKNQHLTLTKFTETISVKVLRLSIRELSYVLYTTLDHVSLDTNLMGNSTLQPLPKLSYTTNQSPGK